MRGAAAVRCLARFRFFSSKPPPASQLAQAKLNLTLAERVAGSAARSDAEARAADYVRRRARAQQPAGEEPPEPFSRPKGALEPLEDGDPRRAYLMEPPPEGGLAGVAELRIRAAQKQGEFDNLRLSGVPLNNVLSPHDATHFTDHGDAIAARILKAANYKPVSLELRTELDEARRVALAELRLAAAAALRCQQGDERGAIATVCGDARLRRSWAGLNATVKAYNNTALADRESFGALWPVHSRRAYDLADDAREAVAEAQLAMRGDAP